MSLDEKVLFSQFSFHYVKQMQINADQYMWCKMTFILTAAVYPWFNRVLTSRREGYGEGTVDGWIGIMQQKTTLNLDNQSLISSQDCHVVKKVTISHDIRDKAFLWPSALHGDLDISCDLQPGDACRSARASFINNSTIEISCRWNLREFISPAIQIKQYV